MKWNFFGLFSKKDKDVKQKNVKQIDNKSVNKNDIKLAEEEENIDKFVNGVNSEDIGCEDLCSQLRDLVNEMCTNRKDKKTRFYNNMIKILFPITKALNGSEVAKNNALRVLSKFSVISSTWNREVRSSVKKLYKLHTDHLKDEIKDEKENIKNVATDLNNCNNEEAMESCCGELYNLISDLVSSRISSRSKFKDSVENGKILEKNIKEITKDNDSILEWLESVKDIKGGHFSSWGKNIKKAVNGFAEFVEKFETEGENNKDEEIENENIEDYEHIKNDEDNEKESEEPINKDQENKTENDNISKVENLKKEIEKSNVSSLGPENKKVEGSKFEDANKSNNQKSNSDQDINDNKNKLENKTEVEEDLNAKQKRMKAKVKESMYWINILSTIEKIPSHQGLGNQQKANLKLLVIQLRKNLAPKILFSFLSDSKTNYTEKLDENSVKGTNSNLEFKYEGEDYKFVFEKSCDKSKNMEIKIKWTEKEGEIEKDLSYLVPYFPEIFGISKESDIQKNAQPKLDDKNDNFKKKQSEPISNTNLNEKRKKLQESIKAKNEFLYKVCEEMVKKTSLKMSLQRDSLGKLLISIFTDDEREILERISAISEAPIGTTIEYEEAPGKKTQVSVSLKCCPNQKYESKDSNPYSKELAEKDNIFIVLINGEQICAENISALKEKLGIENESSDKQGSKAENNPSKNESKPNSVPEVKNNPKSVKQNKMREHIIDTLNSKQKLVDFKIGIEVLKEAISWKYPLDQKVKFSKDKNELREQIEEIKDKPIIKALLSIFNTKDNDSINQISEAKFEGSDFVLVMQNKEELKIGFATKQDIYFKIAPAGDVFLEFKFLDKKKVDEIENGIIEEKKEKQKELESMEAKKKKEEDERKAQEEARKAEEELKELKQNYYDLYLKKMMKLKGDIGSKDESAQLTAIRDVLLSAAIDDDTKVEKILENIKEYIKHMENNQNNPLSKAILNKKLNLNMHDENIEEIKKEKEKEKEKIELIKNLFLDPKIELHEKVSLKDSYVKNEKEGRTLYLSIQGTGTLRINVGSLSKDLIGTAGQGHLVHAIGLF